MASRNYFSTSFGCSSMTGNFSSYYGSSAYSSIILSSVLISFLGIGSSGRLTTSDFLFRIKLPSLRVLLRCLYRMVYENVSSNPYYWECQNRLRFERDSAKSTPLIGCTHRCLIYLQTYPIGPTFWAPFELGGHHCRSTYLNSLLVPLLGTGQIRHGCLWGRIWNDPPKGARHLHIDSIGPFLRVYRWGTLERTYPPRGSTLSGRLTGSNQ